jgi:hypothetical protein
MVEMGRKRLKMTKKTYRESSGKRSKEEKRRHSKGYRSDE